MITIEPIINRHKIKYAILKELVNKNFKDGKKINIFINLDSILNCLYAPNIQEAICDYRNLDNLILSAEVINIIAHYRHFFWSYYGVPSTFYIYQMNTTPRNVFVKDYAKYYMDKITNINSEFMTSNMRLIILLCTYIQKAYFIPSNGLEPSLIPYYILKDKIKNDNELNLILTKDPYDYQLVNFNNTHILRLKYDDSYIINKNNIYDILLKNVKYKPSIDFSPELYSLIMGFGGIKTRDIEPIKGFGMVTTMKKIEKLIKQNKMSNKYTSYISDICDELNLEDEYKKIYNRFRSVDLNYQYLNLSKSEKENIDKHLIDRYDNISLMEVSHEYYKKNPLQIIELCEGV